MRIPSYLFASYLYSYNQRLGAYTPHSKEWIKRRLFVQLKNMSQS
jgi:hypothetical protein